MIREPQGDFEQRLELDDSQPQAETAYLLASPVNAKRLNQAITEVKKKHYPNEASPCTSKPTLSVCLMASAGEATPVEIEGARIATGVVPTKNIYSTIIGKP